MYELNEFDANFADTVANLCFKKFSTLPKSGKPIPEKEWASLAAIVAHVNNQLRIIGLATGTKCIGGTKISDKGDVLNDSHAEVLARRGFMRYLFEEIKALQRGENSSILSVDKPLNKYAIKDGVTFHLFTTQVPCGDASIFPKESFGKDCEVSDVLLPGCKRSLSQSEVRSKKFKRELEDHSVEFSLVENSGVIVTDINRTGAKSLPYDINQDKKQPGTEYHVVGTVRTKPGRGDRTLSVSCSDKILRWNCVGIEGALLSFFLSHPIYLTSIVVSSHPSFYNELAMKRAVIHRNENVEKLCRKPPRLLHTSLEFEFNRRRSLPNAKPSACGIVWCDVGEKNHEVCVEGRRLGWTKKKADKIQPLLVSKKCFLSDFKYLASDGDYDQLTYFQIKKLAARYCKMSDDFKNAVGLWTIKNRDLLSFK
ncbi:tRNA-specific adenosine deaminase 1 [Planococcus citri]|uniref:tRNA-specific adenosine deaminase 1 n=1 Tax=Planococcus citri TaxID=170843 RepID=UPI0031F88864